jgi:hypothetical protein
MTFEFGDTDEANAFFDRNPSFVPFFEKLMVTANQCFGRRVDFKNHLDDVVFSQGHTCRDDFTEVVFLPPLYGLTSEQLREIAGRTDNAGDSG